MAKVRAKTSEREATESLPADYVTGAIEFSTDRLDEVRNASDAAHTPGWTLA
jgi:hypothetical protein